MQQVQFKGAEAILDVGYGDGKITAAMTKKVPFGPVIDVDISPLMVQTAEKAVIEQKP